MNTAPRSLPPSVHTVSFVSETCEHEGCHSCHDVLLYNRKDFADIIKVPNQTLG